MDFVGHVMPHSPYVGICECTASKKVRRLSGSSSSGIDFSASQVVLSVEDSTTDVTGVSNFNSDGEDKSIMFTAYRVPLPIHRAGMN